MADCGALNLLCRAKSGVSGAVTGMVADAFERMCQSFADAGAEVLKTVADAFLASSSIDLAKAGIGRILAITTAIGMGLAVMLLLGQVIRTALTMRGAHLAHGLVGVVKAALATMSVFAVAVALLAAADSMSQTILDDTFGSGQAFADRFAHVVTLSSAGNPAMPAALLLVFGLVAVLVGAVLFCEMVFRHAAVVALVAVSPISAAGMVGGSTNPWWRKFVSAGLQMIFLKPLIVLIFAIGFGIAGDGKDVLGVLAGLATLVIAATAWPLLAKFCTWTSAHVAEAGGATAFVGGFLGSELGRMPGRVLSARSSFDAERAAMARTSARIGGGPAVAAAGVGGVAMGAGMAARAMNRRMQSGMDGMARHGGLEHPPSPPGAAGPSRFSQPGSSGKPPVDPQN